MSAEATTIDEATRTMMAELSALWDLSGVEWVLEVHHVLTEPTCPTASIHPDGRPSVRYRADRDTIQEAIAESVARAHAEWIRGVVQEGFEFWTQPDCPIEALLADARAAGRIPSPTSDPTVA